MVFVHDLTSQLSRLHRFTKFITIVHPVNYGAVVLLSSTLYSLIYQSLWKRLFSQQIRSQTFKYLTRSFFPFKDTDSAKYVYFCFTRTNIGGSTETYCLFITRTFNIEITCDLIWDIAVNHSLISSTPDSCSFSFSSSTLYGIMPFFIITPKAARGDFWTKSSDRLCSLSDGLLCSVRSSCQRLRTVRFILLLELSFSSILTWLPKDEHLRVIQFRVDNRPTAD